MTTYFAYPEESTHTRAVARRLGATPEQAKSGVADYLVLRSEPGEKLTDPGALEYFRTRASRRGRMVVLLPSYESVAGGVEDRAEKIAWLVDLEKPPEPPPPGATPSAGPTPWEPALLRELLALAVGAKDVATLSKVLAGDLKEHFPRVPGPRVEALAAADADGFFYALALLSQGYADSGHDLAKLDPRMVEKIPDSLTPLGRRAAAQIVLAAADALRQSMAAAHLKPGVPGRPFSVLLIDDDEADQGRPAYWGILERVAKAFFPADCTIHSWNPTRDPVAFDGLCAYTSLDAREPLGKLPGVRRLFPEGEEAKRPLDLAHVDFILVDQLYRPPAPGARRGDVRGPALIRGLTRVLHDVHAPCPRPQIVALSRDGDPALIQSAIRNGARDYVLKSQLLRLPAVMSRAQRAAAESLDGLHRNFPELHRLPNETQGLLRAVRIPNAAPLHRPASGECDKDHPVGRQVASLIRRIPKCDLHTHAGSCMSPEFLVAASAIGLARNLPEEPDKLKQHGAALGALGAALRALAGFGGPAPWTWTPSSDLPGTAATSALAVPVGERWPVALAAVVREALVARLQVAHTAAEWTSYQGLRGFLHTELGVRDRLSHEDALGRLRAVKDLDAALFGLRFLQGLAIRLSVDDIIRAYLLTLATQEPYGAELRLDSGGRDLLSPFRAVWVDDDSEAWGRLRARFFGAATVTEHAVDAYRQRAWCLPEKAPSPLRLSMAGAKLAEDFVPPAISFAAAPIEYSLATGLRSKNLDEYLEGCSFSGAEHLRHPFLLHLYAEQALLDLARQGVIYAELRAAPDGYADQKAGFEFGDACACLGVAFGQAQEAALSAYRGVGAPAWAWGVGDGLRRERYAWGQAGQLLGPRADERRFPAKVGLIYVGKRHKTTREMILEAAAAAVMRPAGEGPAGTAADFVARELPRCRVVGFDLAGKEVGNPPERFVEDFAKLSRLHIPLTVHAGENESAQYVEDSILKLRAKRIGHGLSLVEDPGLVARAREDRVGIELCPVSNFQTSHFGGPGSARPYPLRELLERGLLVSINTDNPIISHTNLVKEFFQASYAWGEGGMPLWEALRLVRMGFVMSFLNLQERRTLLEIVGQRIHDIFVDEGVVRELRELAASSSR